MPIITVPKALRDKLGEDGADALVDLFNQSELRQKEDILEFVEEKFERRLSEEIGTLRIEMNERFAGITGEMNERFAEVNERFAEVNERFAKITGAMTGRFAEMETQFAQVDSKIEATKSYMVRWMFAFWVGQVGVIIGILFAFFK